MIKYPALFLTLLLSFSICFADTFVHRRTGESFNGYVVQRKRGNKTQVRIEKRSPRYLDLTDYEIRQNYLGRKNKVFYFSIKDLIDLMCETEALEKAIAAAANQGPLFILIEIDTPGGRVDLTQRICSAIVKTDNCTTVAFVSGGEFGGAFSAGAIVALACDKVYMCEGTSIGAATLYVQTTSGTETVEKVYGQVVGEKISSAWQSYCAAIAERNNRPGLLVKAMVTKDIEVVEVVENDKHLFIDPKDKDPNQTVVRTWSKKDSLMTLTAAEAGQCGIADKIVASRDELFADLAATKAMQVPNRNILKIRRGFEQALRQINEILPSIEYLEERAAALVGELDGLEEEIRRANRVFYRERYVRWGYYPYQWGYSDVEFERQGVLTGREGLLEQLLDVLSFLMRDYRRALSIAEKHPDLHHHVDTLESGLNTAEATYREVRSRPRFGYWW